MKTCGALTYAWLGLVAACNAGAARDEGGPGAGLGSSARPTTGATTMASGSEPSGTTSGPSGATGRTDAVFDLGGGPDVDTTPPPPAIPMTCEEAAAGESSVGCVFYAVDLDATNDTLPFGVALANVQAEGSATISIERPGAGGWEHAAGPFTVESLQLEEVVLPDNHQEGTGQRAGAYRVQADVPIIAYQFQPVDGLGSEFSDASLLYPAATWDSTNHVISTGFASSTSGAGYPYVSIVAMADATTVEFTASNPTRAGGSIPAMAAGETRVFLLNDGDVLSFAAADQTAPLTGSRIISDDDHPVAVFSGHTCINIPDNVCCCDHIEEQIAGVRQWGQSFVAAHMPTRNEQSPEETFWQVYASEDDTTINFDASAGVVGVPGQITLDAGEIEEFFVSAPAGTEADFRVLADRPIATVGYMTGTEAAGTSGMGDPAMAQFVPVEQFLPRYVVLVPDTWINDALVLTRTGGTPITIDAIEVPDAAFTSVSGSTFEVARVPVEDGVHVVDGGEDTFGIVVVGWDEYDSYAYTGGTRTGIINPNPAG